MEDYIVEVEWYQTVRPEDKPVDDIMPFTGTEDEAADYCSNLLNDHYELILALNVYLHGHKILSIQ